MARCSLSACRRQHLRLSPCVLQWFKEDEALSNTARFCDLTQPIQISQVRRKIRTASPGQDGPSLDESVQALDLNTAQGLTSFSRDDLWKAFGRQILKEACSFVRRVVESTTEKKITEGKAVQQILLKAACDELLKIPSLRVRLT